MPLPLMESPTLPCAAGSAGSCILDTCSCRPCMAVLWLSTAATGANLLAKALPLPRRPAPGAEALPDPLCWAVRPDCTACTGCGGGPGKCSSWLAAGACGCGCRCIELWGACARTGTAGTAGGCSAETAGLPGSMSDAAGIGSSSLEEASHGLLMTGGSPGSTAGSNTSGGEGMAVLDTAGFGPCALF